MILQRTELLECLYKLSDVGKIIKEKHLVQAGKVLYLYYSAILFLEAL